MRSLVVGLVLAVTLATIAAEPDPEIFEFDSAEKIDHLNETASSSDVETLSPVKPSDVKVKIEAKCLLPKAEGNGTDQIAVFHFDPKTQTCHPFNYTGSGGNDNIFLSELDCLSDCYLPVGEGTPEREEDVVIIGRSKRDNSEFPAANSFCRLPKDSGNGEEAVEKFYFAPEWQCCLAFKYTGKGGNDNRFDTHRECEGACLVTDGGACHTPSGSAKPLESEFGGTCAQTKCPEGYTCSRHPLAGVSCCKTDEQEALKAAYAETCPDGSKAHGIMREYFVATFGASCEDLMCGENETCQQVNSHFAKCCRNEKSSKTPHGKVRRRQAEPGLRQREDVDDSDASSSGCSASEKRLVKMCSSMLTHMDVAKNVWSSPRILTAEGILSHLNLICDKFEEYRACVAMVTKNVDCLDASVALQEQHVAFLCHPSIRDTISRRDRRCISRIEARFQTRRCEEELQRSLTNHMYDSGIVCDALDKALNCSRRELAVCGSNVVSLAQSIIRTIRANTDGCGEKADDGVNDNITIFRKSHVHSGHNSVVKKDTASKEDGEDENRASGMMGARFGISTNKPACPYARISEAHACLKHLSGNMIRNIFDPKHGFILAKFNPRNVDDYCEKAKNYRKCIEAAMARDDACLKELPDDPFHPFMVAFEDKLCEKEKQVDWLINSPCLTEVVESPAPARCLTRVETDERILCRVRTQFIDCIVEPMLASCRSREIAFFGEVFEQFDKRSAFCLHPPKNRHASPFREGNATSGCWRARQLALFQDASYLPECDPNGMYRPMQCDRKSGRCWCTHAETGKKLGGSEVGPGLALPLCGLKALFTCDYLPSKKYCGNGDKMPQQAQRWYRRGDECVSYLHDYCPESAHVAPIPLRTEKDCLKFCFK